MPVNIVDKNFLKDPSVLETEHFKKVNPAGKCAPPQLYVLTFCTRSGHHQTLASACCATACLQAPCTACAVQLHCHAPCCVAFLTIAKQQPVLQGRPLAMQGTGNAGCRPLDVVHRMRQTVVDEQPGACSPLEWHQAPYS